VIKVIPKPAYNLLKMNYLYIRKLLSAYRNGNEENNVLHYKLLADVKYEFEIREDDKHCFFGYYDKSPFDSNLSYVAYLVAPISRRAQGDAKIKIRNIDDGQTVTIGRTQAWNWQQGAMLQWYDDESIMYNYYDVGRSEYQLRIVNIYTGDYSSSVRPLYSMGKKRKCYLTLNFERLDLFAKGYGYAYKDKRMSLDAHLDGIWEVDLGDGVERLLVTIDELIKLKPQPGFYTSHHYVNHLDYFDNDNQFIFIHRWVGSDGIFKSRLFVYNKIHAKLYLVLNDSHVSHYCWKSDNELLVYATTDKYGTGYHLINLENYTLIGILEGMPEEDGHPSYSDDGMYVLVDTYPNKSRYQYLYIYDVLMSKLSLLKKYYSPVKYFDDYRCDLHPRWSAESKWIAVDTVTNGLRELHCLRLK